MPPANQPDRLWSRVRKTDGCWEWTGTRVGKGYGRMSWQGRQTPTHRVAWMLTHGPIPPGLFVCHRCDNPPCCNPAHLFLGTPEDNWRDMVNKGRERFGKLTADQVREIRALRASGVSARELAARFNIHPRHCRSIVHGHDWARRADGPVNQREPSRRSLTDEQALEVRRRACAGERCSALAAEYGVRVETIRRIRGGRAYRRLEVSDVA